MTAIDESLERQHNLNSTRQRRNLDAGFSRQSDEYELRLNLHSEQQRGRHGNRPPLSEFVAEFSNEENRPEEQRT